MKAPFPYQGSKRKELAKIFQYVDQCDLFIDGCGGGGSVVLEYLERYPDAKAQYNDLGEMPYDLFKLLKNKDRTIEAVNILSEYDFADYENVNNIYVAKQHLVDHNLFYCYEMAWKGALGKHTMYNNRAKYSTLKNRKLEQYSDILKNTNVTNENILELIDEHSDNENVTIYIDPPYIGTLCRGYDGNTDVNLLDELFDRIQSDEIKCKLILNVPFDGSVFTKLQKFVAYVYEHNYNINKNKNKKVYHCLIINHH